MNIARKVIQPLFLLLPLIFLSPIQFSMNLYSNPIFWTTLFFGLILFPIAVKGIKEKPRFILISFLVYLLCLLLSVIFSVNPFLSLPVFILNIAYFVIFLASAEILKSQKSKEMFIIIFLAVVMVLSLISFYNSYIRGYNNLTSEGVSFLWPYFGHNHLAVLLIAAIPLSVYSLFSQTKKLTKVLLGFLLIFLLYSLLISFSRGAVLALVLAFALTGILFLRVYIGKLNIKKIFFFGVLLIVLFTFLMLIFNLKSIRSINSRTILFQKGIEIFRQRPITGYGLSTFNQTIAGDFGTRKRPFFAHNLLIQNLAEGGILLFLGTIMLFVSLGINSIKVINGVSGKDQFFYISLWVGLVGILINEMWDFDLQLPAVGLFFWLVAGAFSLQGDRNI